MAFLKSRLMCITIGIFIAAFAADSAYAVKPPKRGIHNPPVKREVRLPSSLPDLDGITIQPQCTATCPGGLDAACMQKIAVICRSAERHGGCTDSYVLVTLPGGAKAGVLCPGGV